MAVGLCDKNLLHSSSCVASSIFTVATIITDVIVASGATTNVTIVTATNVIVAIATINVIVDSTINVIVASGATIAATTVATTVATTADAAVGCNFGDVVSWKLEGGKGASSREDASHAPNAVASLVSHLAMGMGAKMRPG